MRKALFFLGVLNDSDLDWLIAQGNKADIAAGSILIQQGQPIDSMFIILDGLFSVSTASAPGKEVARLKSGEVLGEMSFLDSRPPSASVRAVEKSSVLAIPKGRLTEKLESDVAFAARFYRALGVFLSDRLRSTIGLLGYGGNQPLSAKEFADEIDPETLDKVELAGARFDWLQRKLKSV
jgi:CRP/FNR family cyclic AMP-dependent transcriptional regulator